MISGAPMTKARAESFENDRIFVGPGRNGQPERLRQDDAADDRLVAHAERAGGPELTAREREYCAPEDIGLVGAGGQTKHHGHGGKSRNLQMQQGKEAEIKEKEQCQHRYAAEEPEVGRKRPAQPLRPIDQACGGE